MTDLHPIRLFPDDDAVAHVGAGLLARTLPRPEWTHEAHLAAIAWLVRKRPDIDLDARIVAIIAGYNESVGGVNDDHHGYHETITRCYLAGIRAFLAERPADESIHRSVNAMLAAPVGARDWPLRFYRREQPLSLEARRNWIEPTDSLMDID
ncbi:hypothetical protein GGQ80_001998 [Sphingomonas jinjuensis]|uniref:Uncharacterized protein n=1 Tax=Sphingomonas jinjuensis TaxID=535907 RepID=A0A840FJF0_9SPHN|nr:hypothetical protein [Sphingomonas jinjuensis]MBB4154088.1 hypothetical protein [Sphingomonas jinjuensis]